MSTSSPHANSCWKNGWREPTRNRHVSFDLAPALLLTDIMLAAKTFENGDSILWLNDDDIDFPYVEVFKYMTFSLLSCSDYRHYPK